jgi:hypothetical protein
MFPALIAKVTMSNALCLLVVLKAAGAIQHLRALQDVHPVQAAIVVLAIEIRLERLMAESFLVKDLPFGRQKERT